MLARMRAGRAVSVERGDGLLGVQVEQMARVGCRRLEMRRVPVMCVRAFERVS